ncbi:MAG TPA: ABC transporter ATP-binding protein [Chthoniobacterales bacterium]|nr:ABC transporter ATP-binding protein [Chthoniobacterales bacterium]
MSNHERPAAPFVFEAVGLIKEYDEGQVHALRGADFQIQDGEFVAIVGPSGSGKTTLLQMLGALDKPSSGKLLYRGESLADLKDDAAYRAHEIGFIFQAFHLLPTFTAIENVQMPMFESDQSRSARSARARELLTALGLEKRIHHFPAKLSGGERQRVAIARSLANSPSVLLADEPSGNLDSKNAVLILDLLSDLHRQRQMTLILITHDMTVARRASRAIQMKDGRIIFDGDPSKLSAN